ncbi:hypothetical protein DRO26_00305 [Candidatus Bathyarchaeota archaeon]|nr:MAG: hypothetical protein DRO26_00305 [Candidatus Bathyarchaeota archaeon]
MMFNSFLNSVLLLVLGLAVTFTISYLLNVFLERYILEFIEKQPKLTTTYRFVKRLVLATVIFVGVTATVFTAFPETTGVVASIFIAAGFVSIVVGLAAQSSLSNIISGVIVSISQPVRIGDAVMFRNDFCFVEDVRLMHTVLRTWDNRRLIVPNSILQNEVITNYTMEDPTMLVPVFVQVSYESDLEKAMKIMVEVAKKHPDCMPIGNLPNVVVMEFADSGITLRLLSRAKDQPTAFMMARDLLLQIKKEFDKNGIEIPYPRRYLVVDKQLEEKLSRIADGINQLLNTLKPKT